MIQKKTWLVIALLIAFVAVGIGCFTLGRNTASSYYEAERDLNIRLNRSELDGLGKIEGPIYVTGHRSPDADTGMDMAFAQISIFHDDLSVTYLVPSDPAAAEVIEAAFGDTAEFDGTSYILKPGISRKQVLVPAITDVLESHPKE